MDLEGRLRGAFRQAGRLYAQSVREHRAGRADGFDLPTDDDGRARIVCRRHAEQRAVELDREGRPHCFEIDHPACEGCVEDVHKGVVETW